MRNKWDESPDSERWLDSLLRWQSSGMGDSEAYRELRNRADGIIYVVKAAITEVGDRIPPDAQIRLRALAANVQLVVDVQGEAPWLRAAITLLEKEIDRINKSFR